MKPNKALYQEQAFLVGRGVRPLALVGSCNSDDLTMLRTVTALETVVQGNAIPFVLDCGDGTADYGYASHKWVIDLYRWVIQEHSVDTDWQRHYVLGLLFGYSPESIAKSHELLDTRIIRPTN